jgi:hypothetical protein
MCIIDTCLVALRLAKSMGLFNGFQRLVCTRLLLELRRSDSHLFCKSQYVHHEHMLDKLMESSDWPISIHNLAAGI